MPTSTAREHPHLDARSPKVSQDLGHAVLQLVLDRRRPLQRELALDLGLQPRDLARLAQLELAHLLGVLVRRAVLGVPRIEVGQLALRKHESAQRDVSPLTQEGV